MIATMHRFDPRRPFSAASLLLLACAACGQSDSASVAAPDTAPDPAPAAAPRFVGQDGWVTEPPSGSMRMLQFRLPGPGDEVDADGVLFVGSWPQSVGPLEGNLDRWVAQVGLTMSASELSPDQRWSENVRDFVVTVIHVEGGAAETPGEALMAAFVEKIGEPHVWTVKALGPVATIRAHRAAIQSFLRAL